MAKGDIPRLCGGTFFTQLLLSRKPTVSQRQRTQGETDVFHNEDVLFALLQVFQPDAIKPTGNSFETYTSNFKKCDGSIGEDLKFDNESVRNAFRKRLTGSYEAVVKDVAMLCDDYIDTRETTRNHENLIKRLIEVIRDDTTIPNDELFRVDSKGLKLNKKALPTITEVSLPDFILSVWAFVILERNDNSVGKETIADWSDPKTKGRYIGNDGTSIEQEIIVMIPTFGDKAQHEGRVSSESAINGAPSPEAEADPKRITVNNYGTIENQKFISIETMNGDINL
jgi:hypothetical protein